MVLKRNMVLHCRVCVIYAHMILQCLTKRYLEIILVIKNNWIKVIAVQQSC